MANLEHNQEENRIGVEPKLQLRFIGSWYGIQIEKYIFTNTGTIHVLGKN